MSENSLVLIKGAGDLASGVAWRLHRCAYRVVMTELPHPLAIRRRVAFAEAVYVGEIAVEGVVAKLVHDVDEVGAVLRAGVIPVLIDPSASCRSALHPDALVDAIVAKRNLGTKVTDAPLVIALGPGFVTGTDCHAVIETKRGHTLGRVVWSGSAEPNTGTPGRIRGHSADRVLRAPCAGHVVAHAAIGDRLHAGDLIATVAGELVRAPFGGVLRGLIHPAVRVWPGLKIGDVDPRGERSHCFTISDKALAVAGGVLEALRTPR
jgi:xanthine dehydrogenase accessory factor